MPQNTSCWTRRKFPSFARRTPVGTVLVSSNLKQSSPSERAVVEDLSPNRGDMPRLGVLPEAPWQPLTQRLSKVHATSVELERSVPASTEPPSGRVVAASRPHFFAASPLQDVPLPAHQPVHKTF
eukprot:CAMPEP_0172688686 /NCGR_PEP_ID=MMETSP1074-20121228/22582_1 /TAXON_ID=2916 /ORGANISM="Ceratium fusus, Strain PA161109" /LENGTH=124 /DNA_ID=CAMNT_0013508373 /DNA_START=837 /DNA_END=1208 /DNA_ORIENTATION=+